MSPLVWAILLIGVFVVIALGLRTMQRGGTARSARQSAESAQAPETAPVASR
ncbi:hypothetical protein [Amycolatopsis cihanbeyliensis]|uniref:Uncharacterized protein n=1 Tax=Amycolatopsis cihanbeyliensis TaxID=1128664 RepID=A0A542DCR3_AMYCI|nr:hypothetical protein [Amycolatopsis cihanbeyliensis]TQJ00845.1 hypothetical protein FB471_0496 [Amycolatopsis cihanbeyliensis]